MQRLWQSERLRLCLTAALFCSAGCTAVPLAKSAGVPRSPAESPAGKSFVHQSASKPTDLSQSSTSDATLKRDDSGELSAVVMVGGEAINDNQATLTVVTTVQNDVVNESEPTSAASQGAAVLTLDQVLALADGQNPNVALARERIQEAYARKDRADVLWLPSLRAGLNYNHHEGQIQDVAGNVFNTNRSSFYGGMGANAVGAGSPAVPGVLAQFHLSDALFQPKIAAHHAASRQFGASVVRNDILRDTAVAYLELVRNEQALAVAIEARNHTRKLTDVTRQFATTGQGLQSDNQRMEAELALREEQLHAREEAVLAASARLAQVVHADASVQLHSGEPVVVPLNVLVMDGGVANYVATGLQRRPELAEQKHLVCEAVERMRREKYAPLVPSVLLGMSYGGLGGGLGSSIINSGDRWDADAVAYWELRNLGFGEKAARDETASLIRQAQHREVAILDRVAREVAEAHAQVSHRQARIEPARAGVVAAEKSYELNLQRIENLQGLPIEALQSISALAQARQSYLNAVIDYNVAQFQLCHAIGWFVEG